MADPQTGDSDQPAPPAPDAQYTTPPLRPGVAAEGMPAPTIIGMPPGPPDFDPAASLMAFLEKFNSFIRKIPDNIRIAADTPSALVTAVPLVKQMRRDQALADIASVPEGAPLAEAARQSNIPIGLNADPTYRGGVMNSLSTLSGDRVTYSPSDVQVQGYIKQGALTTVMVHELQHLRQVQAGLRSAFTGMLRTPEDAITYGRMLEADSEATATDVAYRLKLAGNPAPWNAIQDKKDSPLSPEISAAYAKAVEADPAALGDGRAKRAAFDAWFTAHAQTSNSQLTTLYNTQELNQYPGLSGLETMAQNGATLKPLTADDYRKIGATSAVNYLDIPGARPLDDPYYRAPDTTPIDRLRITEARENLAAAVAPRLAGIASGETPPGAVELMHGTSEDKLYSFLNGLEPRQVTARQKVRSAMEGVAGAPVGDAQVDKLMADNPFLSARAQEISNVLYTTESASTAADYALTNAGRGGEFSRRIAQAMGEPPLTPDGEARPVLLKLEVPKTDILPHGDEVTTDTYETLVKANPDVKVKSVTFAVRDAQGHYTFEGQPALTPAQALAQIKSGFMTTRAAPASGDEEQSRILKTIDDFTGSGDVRVTQPNLAYAAETTVTDATGARRTVRVPDTDFRPQAEENFEKYGFKGVAAHYTLPHDLTPTELNSYLTVLDVNTASGKMTPDEKAGRLSSLLGDFEQSNPALKALAFDRNDPARVERVLRGAVNAYSPENLQFDQTGTRGADYDALKRSALSGALARPEIDLAPAALKGVQAHMDELNAQFAASRAPVQAVSGSPPPAPLKASGDALLVIDVQYGTIADMTPEAQAKYLQQVGDTIDAYRKAGKPVIWESIGDKATMSPPAGGPSQLRSLDDLPQFTKLGPGQAGNEETLAAYKTWWSKYGATTKEWTGSKLYFDSTATAEEIAKNPAAFENQRPDFSPAEAPGRYEGPQLTDALEDKNVKTVAMIGGNRDACVIDTAAGAARKGYNVEILPGAVKSRYGLDGTETAQDHENALNRGLAEKLRGGALKPRDAARIAIPDAGAPAGGLSLQDWDFLAKNGIGLRHIGFDNDLEKQFRPGGMVGDAAPLSKAAEIIEREKTGKSALYANPDISPDAAADLRVNTADFNAALRSKIRAIVDGGIRYHSQAQDGSGSTFMLVRNMSKTYSENDYESGQYPLGKIGREDGNPVTPQKIVSVLQLSDAEKAEVAAGRANPADILTDKIIASIPETRRRLAQDPTPAPPPKLPSARAPAAAEKPAAGTPEKPAGGLAREDWDFLEKNGIGLRHIGFDADLAKQFSPGGMVGDAAPLSKAAEIIERERTGGSYYDASKPGAGARLDADLGNNTQDFNAALRGKIHDIVAGSIKDYSQARDGSGSTFMLVRDMTRYYDENDYQSGKYPLGKIGRELHNPVTPQKIVSVLQLTDAEKAEVAAGRADPADIFTDKIMASIPETRQRLAKDPSPAPPPKLPSPLSRAADIAKDFREGKVPAGQEAAQAQKFRAYMEGVAKADPKQAASAAHILMSRDTGALTPVLEDFYAKTMAGIKTRNPEDAASLADAHLHNAKGNPAALKAASAFADPVKYPSSAALMTPRETPAPATRMESQGTLTASPSKFVSTGRDELLAVPHSSGLGGAGAGSIGLIMSADGLIDAWRTGDRTEAAISGINLATSGLQVTEGLLDAAGRSSPLLETGGKFVPGLGVAMTIADGVYRISKEDTTEHKVERGAAVTATATTGLVLGTATATAGEAATITTGVTAVLGTGATGAGAAAIAVAAAPVVLTTIAVGTVAYTADKAIEAKRAWDGVETSLKQYTQPEKRAGITEPDGKPSVRQYGHIFSEMLTVSSDMKDANLNGKPARDAEGHMTFEGAASLDMRDPKNIAELQRALDQHIAQATATMKANDSILPRWMRSSTSAEKYTDAETNLAFLSAARTELDMYKQDLGIADPAAPADQNTVARTASPAAKKPSGSKLSV